jgi:putative addiction module component (TIGR02574 family)
MAATYNSVLQDALLLPVAKRSRIATRLIESVDDIDHDGDLSPAWQAEINRRMESIRQETAQLVPHDEVMAGVRHKLAEQRTAKSA